MRGPTRLFGALMLQLSSAQSCSNGKENRNENRERQEDLVEASREPVARD